MYGPVGYKGYGRGFHGRPHGYGWGGRRRRSPGMGFLALFLLFMVFTKGFFIWPLLLMFGFYMFFGRHWQSDHRGSMPWGDYPEKYKNDEKRKNDDDDEDEIYYV